MSFHDSIPARAAIALVLAITLAACGTTDDPSSGVDDVGSVGASDTTTLAPEDEAGDPGTSSTAQGADGSGASEDGSEAAADAEASEDTTVDDKGASTEPVVNDMAAALPPPSCADLAPTPSQSEGPFYTPDTPERDNLREPGDPGTPLRVTGYVLDVDCRTLAGAKLDIWQTDDAGDYDNEGYGYRGHVFTDEAGAYAFDTVLPGTYPGRPRHIHLRIHAPGETKPTLTSQLYFQGDGRDADTSQIEPTLLVDLEPDASGEGFVGRFDFVLPRP